MPRVVVGVASGGVVGTIAGLATGWLVSLLVPEPEEIITGFALWGGLLAIWGGVIGLFVGGEIAARTGSANGPKSSGDPPAPWLNQTWRVAVEQRAASPPAQLLVRPGPGRGGLQRCGASRQAAWSSLIR
jgi:hypothetical protein